MKQKKTAYSKVQLLAIWGIYTIDVLAFVPLLYTAFISLLFFFMGGGFPAFVFFITPVIFGILSIWFLFRFIKALKNGQSLIPYKKPSARILFFSHFVVCVLLVLLTALYEYSLASQQAPQLFKFDDNTATYTVVNIDGNYAIHYETPNKTPFNMMDVFIYKSPVKLDPFVGKPVIVRGAFINANQQCLPTCHTIPTSVSINISSIRLQNTK